MIKRTAIIIAFALLSSGAMAQMLRYDQHRELEPPEYATLRLGPFYSNLSFSQTAGFRYTKSDGTGTDFLFGNNRGMIKKDGWEYPLVARLDARNYLLISRHMDLDISFSLGYAYYPMDTQENEFFFDLAQEGVSGSISMEFYISKFVRGRIVDDIVYRTDYIDLRGIQDNYGGQAYEHLENTVKLDADWLMDEGKSLGGSLSRTDLIVMSDTFSAQEHYSWQEELYYEQQLAVFLVGGARASFGQTAYGADTRAESASQDYSLYSNIRLTDWTTAGLTAGYSTGSSDDLMGGSVDTMAGSASLTTQLTKEMRHGVSAERGLHGGFSTPFDIYSTFSYELSYENERTAITFRTAYSASEPQTDAFNNYSDWVTGLDVELPLTRFIGLLCAAEYTARYNGQIANSDLTDPEYTSNYETMSLRLGTSFSITRKIKFDIYGQHIDRLSDNPDLEYSRDIFAGTFSFSHAF